MMFDVLVILSPTILAAVLLYAGHSRAARRAQEAGPRVRIQSHEITMAPSISRAPTPVNPPTTVREEPRLAHPAEAPTKPLTMHEIRDTATASLARNEPTLRASRREPPVTKAHQPVEVFHIDFDKD